jgi:large subunit ribosomal protein L17
VRHRKDNVGLNRTAAHRKALLANLTTALVTHKKIVTTLPKARATRRYAERIITFARRGDVASRRQVLRKLHHRDVVKVLFDEIGPKYADRNGGYTRIIKLDNRHGDNAEMAILELVGFSSDEPVKPKKKKATKKAAPKKAESKKADKKQAEDAPVEAAEETEEVTEETAAEGVKAEESASEEAPAEEAKEQEVPAEEAKTDEAKADEAKAEKKAEEKKEAKADKKEDAKADDDSKDEPKADEGEEEKK